MASNTGEKEPVSDDEPAAAGSGSLMLRGIKQAFQGLLGRTEKDEVPAEETTDDEAAEVEVTPRSILEAMLFVGNEGDEPMSVSQAAELMRGVEAHEIRELVKELNESYKREDCPYQIVSAGAGYRLQLCEEFDRLRDRFYGRIRRARLSQAAIDVLAVVAYHQPVVRTDVDRLRSKPSGSLLSQLVRRELLKVERTDRHSGGNVYRTTDRFLRLFGLESLEDLPQSDEFEKTL